MNIRLTESQAKAFADVNKRLGMGPTETTFSQEDSKSSGGATHFSSDPLSSHIPPKIVPVASIAELNKLVGIADTNDDSHVEYPVSLPKAHLAVFNSAKSTEEFHSSVTHEMHANIHKAATAYVLGNSKKVHEYEPLINARMFPGKVAVFVAQNITVTAESPLIIKPGDPQLHNYGIVTIKPGGYIRVEEHATFNVQQFIVE
jgi:hypothetical protein